MLATLAVGLLIGVVVILVLRLLTRRRPDASVVSLQPPAPTSPAPAALPAAAGSQELDQLWNLHQKGALTAEEFNTAKARLLGAAPAPSGDGLYSAVLTACGANKIQVIKELRELTGLGLKEAKDGAEGTPFVIKVGLTGDQARKIQADLAAVGAQVEIR